MTSVRYTYIFYTYCHLSISSFRNKFLHIQYLHELQDASKQVNIIIVFSQEIGNHLSMDFINRIAHLYSFIFKIWTLSPNTCTILE